MQKIRKNYNGTNDWNVAGLFIHDDFWLPFLYGLRQHDIELPFQYIYGAPYNCPLNSGRGTTPVESPIGMSNEKVMQAYFDLGIGCRMSFSNHLISAEHYQTESINNLLAFLDTQGMHNGIIMVNDDLNKYIKENYSNLQRICSIIRPALDVGWGNDTADYYNKLAEEYDLVVLNCGFAKDLDKLNQLEQKDKFEILVNTRCTLNCKLAKMHYDIIAEEVLADKNDDVKEVELTTREKVLWDKCMRIKGRDVMAGANFSTDEIQTLMDNGFTHFKLEGRNWPINVVARDVAQLICDEEKMLRLYKNGMGQVF